EGRRVFGARVVDRAEAEQRRRRRVLVVGLAGDGELLLVIAGRAGIVTEEVIGLRKVVQRVGFTAPVAGGARDVERRAKERLRARQVLRDRGHRRALRDRVAQRGAIGRRLLVEKRRALGTRRAEILIRELVGERRVAQELPAARLLP